MRHRPLGWRGVVVLGGIAWLGGALGGCREPAPSCEEAWSRYFDRCDYALVPSAAQQRLQDRVDRCEETLAQARATGCQDVHARYRSCVATARCQAPGDCPTCLREEAAISACLAGQRSFELRCGDDKDDDHDGLTDCWDPDCVDACECGAYRGNISLPEPPTQALDLLFVIEDASAMQQEQAMLRAQVAALETELQYSEIGMPDLHVGVTSTDLGAGGQDLLACAGSGDGGRLLTGSCSSLAGAPYLIDVAPQGCAITRGSAGTCSAHDCTEASCAHEPATHLEQDPVTGCPRCRNYAGQDLSEAMGSMMEIGTSGCPFGQPLEAMRLALDDNPANAGFLRESSLLGVVFVTDRQDCSASDPSLFDASATSIDSPLGPLTGFRCFEFGVRCDVNDRTVLGARDQCAPRDDPGALLYPISRYTDFLDGLRDPQMLVVAAIAGPTNGGTAQVDPDELGQPSVQPSCTTPDGGAQPTFRLHALASAFNDEEGMSWAYTSVCSPTFTVALEGLGSRLSGLVDSCLWWPLKGCVDPGAELGNPADECDANDLCRPTCEITEVQQRGTLDEISTWVPPCLEVCPDGPCPGNTDPAKAYAGGHPDERDPSLPWPVCWQVRVDDRCTLAKGAVIQLSRRDAPKARTFAYLSCLQVPSEEQLCNDGVDNDEDCLIDREDPDCR